MLDADVRVALPVMERSFVAKDMTRSPRISRVCDSAG
jgi:hypothetical protein